MNEEFEAMLGRLGASITAARKVAPGSTIGKMHRHIALAEAKELVTILSPPKDDDLRFTVWHKFRFMYSVTLKDGRRIEDRLYLALQALEHSITLFDSLVEKQETLTRDKAARTSRSLRLAFKRLEDAQTAWVGQE